METEKKRPVFCIAKPREMFSSKLCVHHSIVFEGTRLTFSVTRLRGNNSIFLEPLDKGNDPITHWVLQAIDKPCWIKHTYHIFRPRERNNFFVGSLG